jgi:hypothetical protein
MAGRRGVRGERGGRERGISTVEVVILTPVVVLFALTMVGAALYAQNVSAVQGAAADTARMASLQSAPGTVKATAMEAATADLVHSCNDKAHGIPLTVTVTPRASSVTNRTGVTVAMLEATLTCKITQFGVSYTVTESSYAPIDTFGGQNP